MKLARVSGTMKIVYTHTDEAPALATQSLLPIVRAFAGVAGVELELRDISLAGRILAQFPDRLSDDQRVSDALAELGELATEPDANIIKLPNISASVPQLKAAVSELQQQGYDIPNYPDDPADDEQREIRERYDRVKGSAVNPVLREGNSDRRAPASVKQFARNHPHSMGEWSSESRSHVTTMEDGDFRSTERSVTAPRDGEVRIEHVADDGTTTVLKAAFPILEGEVLDAAVMRRAELETFLAAQIADAKRQGVLFSVHLKATMMKVSDPIIFGHAVRAYFPFVFGEHAAALASAGVDANDGVASLLTSLDQLPDDEREAVTAAIDKAYEDGPSLAMVDSDRGITSLHVPSDVIIDASMPAAIRSGGQMWNREGEQQDTKFVIPDHSYAALYAETLEDCRRNGAFDPATMGTTPNVGLMAQKAEEYGSHDKTFEIAKTGSVRVDRDRQRRDAARARGFRWRHLADVPDQGRRDPGLGRTRRASALGRPAILRCSGWRRAAPTTPSCWPRSAPRSPSSTPTGCRSRSVTSPMPPGSRSSGHGRVRTRSRSRATSCATTSPTCSRSSSWARAPRCSRSCRSCGVAGCSRRAPAARRPSTCSSSSARTICAGTRWVNFWPWPCPWRCSPTRPRIRARGCSARRWTGPPAPCSRRTVRRRARWARSTTAAATSTWRSTGRASSPSSPMTPSWRERFQALAAAPGRRGGDDRRRARRGAGLARRAGRLLPARSREGPRRDAPERDVQRGDRVALAGRIGVHRPRLTAQERQQVGALEHLGGGHG